MPPRAGSSLLPCRAPMGRLGARVSRIQPCTGGVSRDVPGDGSVLFRSLKAAALWSLLAALLAFGVSPTVAQHQTIGHLGKNRLTFAPVAPFVLPEATGTGIVDYRGGREPSSRWRASFRFSGLQPGASYTVVIEGRFGAQGSP